MAYKDKNKRIETRKAYYLKNKEKIAQQRKEYYQQHKEETIKKAKEYYSNHREELNIGKKQWRINNSEKVKKRKLEYYQEHREETILKTKKYAQLHRKETNIYFRNKRATNIHFKLSCNLRTRLYQAIRNDFKTGSAVKDLGCTIPELKIWLESKFQNGMSWDNWSFTGWNIDHKIPLKSFDLTDRTQFLEACNYKNLQPMWAEENNKKSCKLCY